MVNVMTTSEKAAFRAAFSRLNLKYEEDKVELLDLYLHLLIEKNKDLNLTRIDSFEDAVVLHIEDSLAVLNEFNLQDGLFCDIGTGGGIPGIPLAIVSGRKGVLLDSVQKKASAVQGFITKLSLNNQIDCVGIRSELFASDHLGEFGTVIARAVSSLVVVEELASPLLANGGSLVAMRGSEDESSVDAAKNACLKLGFELTSHRDFYIGVPSESFHRSVYVFTKISEPQMKLPRRPGMASKRPVA